MMWNICEGVVYKKTFKQSPIKKDVEHLFNLNLKYDEEGNERRRICWRSYVLSADLIKQFMISLYGQKMVKDFVEKYKMRSESWLEKISMNELLIMQH